MRKTALLFALALAACQRAADAPAPPPSVATGAAAIGPVNPDPGVRTYVCDDGRTLEAGYPTADTAVVDVGGHAHPLRRGVSASGARYVGYGLQWWTKGLEEGRLSRLKDGETVASDPGVLCRSQPPGRARGTR